MSKPVEHYVQILLKRDALTEEMRASFFGLYDKVKDRMPGFVTYQTVLLEDGPGDTCTVLHRMVFMTHEDLMAFKECSEHITHIGLVKPAVVETIIRDL